MGTSRSFPTPSGGGWTDAKRAVTSWFNSPGRASGGVVGRTIEASGGLGGDGGGGGGGGGGGRGGGSSAGRAAAGLGGFGAAVAAGALADGLRALNLGNLEGRPAAEVVAAIAEHLSEGVQGTEGELLQAALRDALFDIAEAEGSAGYESLESALHAFLADRGVEGLVENFLTCLVVTRVWFHVENHAQQKASSASELEALQTSVEMCVREQVREVVADANARGAFDRMDWFGQAGRDVGGRIASDLEARLRALE